MGKSLKGWFVREYEDGDEEAILQLFQRAYGRECPVEYWRWKYRDAPLGPGALLIFDAAGALIGHLGSLVVPGKIAERILPVAQAVDLMVDPAGRQGLRQGRFAWVLSAEIMRIFGNEARASFIFGFPMPAAQTVNAAPPGAADLGPVSGLLRDLSPPSRTRFWQFRVAPLRLPDPAVDALWQRVSGQFSMALIRDSHYLTWRYAHCPTVAYQCLGLYDRWRRRLEGLAVLREEFPGWPISVLVDWLVPRDRPEIGQELLAACERLARTAGRAQLFTWVTPGSPEEKFFRAHGYRDHPTPYHIIASVHSPGLAMEWVREHWYYTPGDSDIF